MSIFQTLPTSTQAVAVPAATDWVGVSKILVLEIGFLASLGAVLTGHGNADTTSLVWAIGGTLGLLRISDVVANVANVRAFLRNPQTGVVPQAAGTPLFATPASTSLAMNGGTSNASPSAP